jgi:hypothetical protein
MKWLLLSALAFTLPAFPMARVVEKLPNSAAEECEPDPDLFKKDAQIYSGHLEFLYWSAAAGDLDYAIQMKTPAWGPSNSYAQGSYQTATYNIDPGFRLGMHYFRAPHYWEVRWHYTRMTNRGINRTRPRTDDEFVTGTWPQVSPNPLARAKSEIHLNYNVFDMLIDRVFIPNPHLRLRVIGGVFAAWINQDWNIHYVDTQHFKTAIRNRWSFIGAGLKTGAMFDWYWTGELYMTAAGNFGLAMGSYTNRSKQTTNYQPTPNDNTSVPIRNGSYSDARPTVTAQMLLGPSWQKNLPHNRIELFAGFEMNMWMNLQEVYRSTAGGPSAAKETWINSSMLALYGLTTRLTVDF